MTCFRRSLLAVLLSIGVLAACDSPTNPKGESSTVSLSVTATKLPVVGISYEGWPTIACQFRFGATTEGARGTSTPIRGMVFYWFIAADTVQPVDSTIVSAAEARAAWGRDALPAGETVYAEWSLSAGVPFNGLFRLHYGGEDKPKAADVRFICEPSLLARSGPAPLISGVVVSPQRELEPGDTVTISFTTRSTVGLWLSAVEVPGGVPDRHVFAGNLATQQTHTARFEVGADITFGEPMQISIFALDGLVQEAHVFSTQTAPIYDRTAPTLYHSFTTGSGGRNQGLVGQYALGDTIHLNVRARDNHRLAYIIYELGAPANVRDSIAVAAGPHRDYLGRSLPMAIAIRSEWVGTRMMRIFARDVAGNLSEPRSAHPDSFRIYSEVPASTQRVTLPFRVNAAVFDPERKRLALLPRDHKELHLFSLESMTLVRTVPLPAISTGGDFTLSGDSLIVALPQENAFAVVDLTGASASPVLIPLNVSPPLQQRPHHLQVLDDGLVLAVLRAEAGQEDEVLELSLASGSQRLLEEFRSPYGNTRRFRLARSAERSMLVLHSQYRGCIHRFAFADRRFGSCLGRIYSSYTPLSFSHGGASMLIDAIVTNRDFDPVRSLWSADLLFPGVISPSGQHVYLTQRRGVARVRVADGEYLERYAAPVPRLSIPQQVFITPGEDALILLVPLLEATEIVRVSRP